MNKKLSNVTQALRRRLGTFHSHFCCCFLFFSFMCILFLYYIYSCALHNEFKLLRKWRMSLECTYTIIKGVMYIVHAQNVILENYTSNHHNTVVLSSQNLWCLLCHWRYESRLRYFCFCSVVFFFFISCVAFVARPIWNFALQMFTIHSSCVSQNNLPPMYKCNARASNR